MAANLSKLHKEELKKNEEESYLAYVAKNGERTEEKYYDALSSAQTQKKTSDTNYGAAASSLLASGMNFSGYEDYLRAQREKSYIERTKEAEHKRSADEYANKAGYAKYLSNYEALQNKMSDSVIKQIASGSNFSIEDAYAEAVRAGISKDLAYFTAATGVRKAIEATVEKAILFAKVNNLSANKAREYAEGLGLDKRYSKQVYDEISVLSDSEKEFFSNMTSEQYYDYIISQSNKK